MCLPSSLERIVSIAPGDQLYSDISKGALENVSMHRELGFKEENTKRVFVVTSSLLNTGGSN